MAVTDWKTPGTCASVDKGDYGVSWDTPSNAAASDDNYTSSVMPSHGYSDWLRLTNFGFDTDDIPEGVTINGIEVKVEHKASGSYIYDAAIYLRNSVGQVGDDKASASQWATSDEEITYGGAEDDWNSGLDNSDIRDSTFGIDISAYSGSGFSRTAYIDCVSIRVYYTPAITEKSSSDTGSGVDAYVSLEIKQAKASSDTGSGVEAKASGNPVATLAKIDTGSGADVLSEAQAILDAAETGNGVDAVDSLQTPESKSSSDAGSGVEGTAVPSAFLIGSETGSGVEGTAVPSAFLIGSETGSGLESTPVPSAILSGSETGSGIEALIARLLAAPDTGGGAEASSIEIDGVLKELFASELGRGGDCLAAKIEMPTKGGGMKLWI